MTTELSRINKSWSLADVIKEIPPGWRDGELTIGDNLQRAFRVKRIALVKNKDGKKIIILSWSELKVDSAL